MIFFAIRGVLDVGAPERRGIRFTTVIQMAVHAIEPVTDKAFCIDLRIFKNISTEQNCVAEFAARNGARQRWGKSWGVYAFAILPPFLALAMRAEPH